MLRVLRPRVGHEAPADVGGNGGTHGRALNASTEGVGVRRADQRRHDAGLRQNLKEERKKTRKY